MQVYYLISAITLFLISGILLAYGLPNTIMHPRPGGIILYGGGSFLDRNGNIIDYYDPIYAQITVYGILASVVGVVMMFALYRTSKKKGLVENST
jgi:hypothetical protein